jgi:hypothetical protein
LTYEDGEAGLLDGRLGKASGRRVPSDRADEVERLYRERYQGFTVKPFHEHLVKDHGFGWGYTWLKLHLQWGGVVAKAPDLLLSFPPAALRASAGLRRGARLEQHAIGGAGLGCADDRVLRRDWRRRLPA